MKKEHFGHTEQFKFYDVEDGRIVSYEVADTNGSGHGNADEAVNALLADTLSFNPNVHCDHHDHDHDEDHVCSEQGCGDHGGH